MRQRDIFVTGSKVEKRVEENLKEIKKSTRGICNETLVFDNRIRTTLKRMEILKQRSQVSFALITETNKLPLTYKDCLRKWFPR